MDGISDHEVVFTKPLIQAELSPPVRGVRHALKSRTLRLKSVFKTQIKFSNHKSVLKTQISFQIAKSVLKIQISSQICQIRFSNHKAAYKSLNTPQILISKTSFSIVYDYTGS